MKKNLILLGLAALLLCNMPANASPHHGGGPHDGMGHRPAPIGYHHPGYRGGINFGIFSGYYPRQCEPIYFNNYPLVYPVNAYPMAYYYPTYPPYYMDYGSNVMLNFRF